MKILLLIAYILIIITMWSLCKVAGDTDKIMEEMLKEKKAKDAEKLNK